MTGAKFAWEFSEDIPTFETYASYLLSVTTGGEASGPDKAKFGRNNKSKTRNCNREYDWVSFQCRSCVHCSNEVGNILKSILIFYVTID